MTTHTMKLNPEQGGKGQAIPEQNSVQRVLLAALL